MAAGPCLARGFLQHMAETGREGEHARFDTAALVGIFDVQAQEGSCSCRLRVGQAESNRYDTLHGGCIATLVDVVGSAALLTLSPKGGVSLNINVNYLNPLPTGREALIEAKVVKLGRSVATIDVTVSDGATRQVVATGTHVKFISSKEPPLADLLPLPEQRRLQEWQRTGECASRSSSSSSSPGNGTRGIQSSGGRPWSKL